MPPMERAEVRQRVQAIARDIHTLAVSSYGPAGRVKALQPNEDTPDAVELTTSAERICDRIGASECPIANVYLHILKSRLRNHCDGGLVTMILSSKLQLMARSGSLANTPPLLVAQGYSLALEWCLAYLDDLHCPVRVPVDWSDTVALFAVMRGILRAKPMASAGAMAAQDDERQLLPLLVETFVSVLPFVTANPGESLPIRFHHDAAYASSSSSRVLKNSVLLDYTHHAPLMLEKLILQLSDGAIRIVLFSITLDPFRRDSGSGSDGSGITIDDATSPHNDEDVAFHELSDAIAALDVRVVVSQKLIPEMLQVALARRGILSIERLGISHMRAVELLTGATAIGDWRTLHANHFPVQSLGSLSSVTLTETNHRQMLLLQNNGHGQNASFTSHGGGGGRGAGRAWPVATLVLLVTHEYVYMELVHAIKVCFKRLVVMMEQPVALAGAGCVEIHMAAWLRRHAEKLTMSDGTAAATREAAGTLRRLRTVVNGFADALESIAVALDHGIHGMASEVVEQLVTANTATLTMLPESESYTLYGWNPHGDGGVVPVVTVRQDEDGGSSSSSSSTSSSSSSSSDEDESSDDGSDDSDRHSVVVTAAFVLDSLQTKRESLVSAVECATALLRITGVIYTTPGA